MTAKDITIGSQDIATSQGRCTGHLLRNADQYAEFSESAKLTQQDKFYEDNEQTARFFGSAAAHEQQWGQPNAG
jgi:hypothetical protein